ncbi:MAG: DNA topoisomerase VI, partial [Zestosphaera sp.]
MSSSTHLTSKDLSARSKALEVLRSKFNEVIEEVMNGRTPTLVIRKRTLTNTIYDEVNGLLKLGEGVLKRSF